MVDKRALVNCLLDQGEYVSDEFGVNGFPLLEVVTYKSMEGKDSFLLLDGEPIANVFLSPGGFASQAWHIYPDVFPREFTHREDIVRPMFATMLNVCNAKSILVNGTTDISAPMLPFKRTQDGHRIRVDIKPIALQHKIVTRLLPLHPEAKAYYKTLSLLIRTFLDDAKIPYREKKEGGLFEDFFHDFEVIYSKDLVPAVNIVISCAKSMTISSAWADIPYGNDKESESTYDALSQFNSVLLTADEIIDCITQEPGESSGYWFRNGILR